MRVPKRSRRIGKPLPASFEAQLLRALLPMQRQIRATLKDVATLRDAKRIGAAIKREWSDRRILELVTSVGVGAVRASAAPWASLVARKDAPGDIDGDALLASWARNAMALVTSVRDDVAAGLRRDILAAQKAGTSSEVLAARWIRKGIPVLRGTLEGRMRVIAQHQMQTLHAEVQRTRAHAVGVTEFVWRALPPGPNRRETHQGFSGKSYTYDKPPDGLPGQPINCKCWAESIVPDELTGA